MKKIYSRLLVFFIGIPVILALILLLPGYSHLAANAVFIVIVALGSTEVLGFYRRLGHPVDYALTASLAPLFPIATYLEVVSVLPPTASAGVLLACAYAILVRQLAPRGAGEFGPVLRAVSADILALVYPGVFGSFFVRLSSFPAASYVILSFLVLVFVNDTAAYVFGMLAGGTNRGVVRVSPNKSLVGFISGLALTCVAAYILHLAFPSVFGGSAAALACGAVVGLAAVVGDLVESALKRSASVKDSGEIIPGRGGVLDSIDSIVFAAPVFYLALTLIGG